VKNYTESEKREARFKFLEMRDRTEPVMMSAYSAVIAASVRKLAAYVKAKTVMFYLSYGSEVITDAMIQHAFEDGKEVVVPAIENPGDGEMLGIRITRLEDSYNSVYGIRQPEITGEDIVNKSEIDLVFVPAIAFDRHGYRIGYGKGYFDRYLAGLDQKKAVGLAYESQITDKLPIAEFDLPVGMIVTEKEIINIVRN
jgi:5-formyltetrahydrofolate cyclo-ligase